MTQDGEGRYNDDGNTRHRDDGNTRKHVVFGKVVKGIDVAGKIEQLGTADGKPSSLVKIVDCGEISESKLHNENEAEKGIVEVLITNNPIPGLLDDGA
ncbi:peptidylprolyl isomerase [Sarracenia purpurea var. burkii]